jgi:hypothetical protein
MAETEIDKLSLEIEVKGATTGQTKRIDAFAKSLDNLNKALPLSLLNKLERLSNLTIGFKAIQNAQKLGDRATSKINGSAIPPLTQQKKVDEVPANQLSGLLKKIVDKNAENARLQQLLNDQLGNEQSKSVISQSAIDEAKAKKPNIPPLENVGFGEVATLLKKKSVIGQIGDIMQKRIFKPLRLLNRRFFLVASLMAMRKIIREIAKLIGNGVKNFGLVDKSANETMSRLKTSLTNISNSLGMIIMPILEAFVPIVEQIAQGFVKVANFISESVAQMKGLAKYTKISADYMADYQANAGGRASFDTFTSLSSTAYDMFDEEKVGAVTEKTSALQELVKSIKDLVTSIFEAIKPVFTIITNIVQYLIPSLTQINVFLTNIFDVVGSLLNMVLEVIDPIIQPVVEILLPTLLSIINDCLDPIFKVVKGILDFIEPIISNLTDGVMGTLTKIITTCLTPITNFIKTMLGLIDELISPITDILLPAIRDKVNGQLEKSFNVLNWVIDVIGNIIKALDPMIAILKNILTPMINAIAYTIESISRLMNGILTGNWEGLGKAFKNMLISVANLAIGIVEGIVNGFISAINGITQGLSSLWTWAGIPAIPVITWKADWQIPYLANGGMVNAGSMFVAGESGAELVANLGSGQTGVMNIAQFTEAVVNGIAQSGIVDAIKEGGNIYLDNERVGMKVGSSKGLKQALNRTNPALGLK